jgi:FAD/FMN-containing dehydrogenase
MSLSKELQSHIEGDVASDEAMLLAQSIDTSIFSIRPECVVFPKNVEDLKKLVTYAREHPGELTLTARAAGTDMSGGPLTSSVVVNFMRYFNAIVSVDEKTATAQPGVYYRDFEKETLKYGVLLPSYPASRELCALGGMVANNGAGEKSLTYGKTGRYVRELKAVLSDGNEYTFTKLGRVAFEAKKAQSDFEGEVYRRIGSLIDAHQETIEKEKPTVSKNSAGYAIWDVHNKEEDTFDLTKLFIGSQGTLGLFTEFTFDLVKPKAHARMLVMFLRPKHMSELGEIINAVLAQKPESFESYDDKTFNVMLRVFPKLFVRLGGNPFKLAHDFFPELKMIATGGIPKLVLMAEFTGDSQEEVIALAHAAEERIRSQFALSTHVTASEKESEKFWTIRRESFNLLRENVHGKHTAPFIDDLSVRPEHLPAFLPRLYAILDEYKLIYTVAGHVGDGNFHIIPLMDYADKHFTDVVNELSNRVYTLVGEYHGSITGEHNDGLIRTPYLHKMFSPQMLSIFDEIKDIFDPLRMFNPHKKVDPQPELLRTAVKRSFEND